MAKAKKSKSTKKFEKNHLKDTIDRRKEFAKVQQRHQAKAKRQKRAERQNNEDVTRNEIHDGGRGVRDGVDRMNDDEFFQQDFQILESPGKGGRKPSSKETESHTSKRKRAASGDETAASEQFASDFEGLSGSEEFEPASESGNVSVDHKGELNALAEKDPEFYKYLQENDADLLDFDEDQDLAGIDALSDDDEDEDSRPSKKSKASKGTGILVEKNSAVEVTSDMIEKWKSAMVEHQSIRSLRQLVLAFQAAVHINDEDDKVFKYKIPNPDIYHDVLVTALKYVSPVLNHHLPVKESSAGKIRVSTESVKFKTLAPLIKSHCSSAHHLLSHLSDAPTLKMTLQSFEPMLPYLLQFRKFLKVVTKSVVVIWADNSVVDAIRVTAFMILRRLSAIGDTGIREAVFKSSYEGIVKGSRNTTAHTLSGINLMKNSAAEVWGVDQRLGYTTAFTFVRQLAIHLRGNIKKPTKDSYKAIYNWQFVHSLDFWSRVLSTHCNSLVEAQNGHESQLRPLIYPVVQIILGVIRLIPTSSYFPLRFQLIRSLLRVSNATGTYIPLAPMLLEVLTSAEMRKPPKPTTIRPLDFSVNIRAPSSYLKSRVYQDGTGEQVIELFSEFFVLWTKSIAFPELQLPVTIMLKRWLRIASSKSTGNKNAKLNQGLGLLVQKLEANARWIEERRNQVQFSPKDRAEVEAFLKDTPWEETPLGAFVAAQRKIRDERKKIFDHAKEEERKRGEQEAER